LALKKKVERTKGRRRGRSGRLKVAVEIRENSMKTEVFGVVIVGCNCLKKQTTDEKKLAKYTPYPCTSRAA
jgi:hypothetical protein